MAAILFQIHKKSHTVAIVSKAGDEQIYNGFNNYLADLHKSPIRDLAIYGEAADIGDAKSEPGRYIYFLDAIGWPNEKTLSVLGFRPSSPAGDHLAYAGFVFSRKLDAFKEICMLKQLRSSAERAIGVALIAQALDARLARMKRKAELSTDFQFLAHEANYFLKRPADLLDKMQDERQLSWEDFRLVIGYLNRSRRAMNIFLHWDDVVDNELNPGEVSMELADTIRKEWDLPQTLQLEVNVDREVEQTFQARRLAYESVLRNLLLNAVQQIQDYCKNSGRVVVDLKLRKAKGEPLTLVTMVRDNGPGIHAKYKNSIFDSEFTTRASGTGFGLTLSRDLITKAQGTLELKDSFIYGGTTFELTLPISRLPHTKS
jgi:signal transduction histidine kinase